MKILSVKTINSYIKTFPEDVQSALKKLQKTIAKAAPKAEQTISYGIATFKLGGKNLVHFGGFKNHVGFFPGPSPIKYFKKELSKFKTSKGTIQLPLNKPLPIPLINKIVKFRVKETLTKLKK